MHKASKGSSPDDSNALQLTDSTRIRARRAATGSGTSQQRLGLQTQQSGSSYASSLRATPDHDSFTDVRVSTSPLGFEIAHPVSNWRAPRHADSPGAAASNLLSSSNAAAILAQTTPLPRPVQPQAAAIHSASPCVVHRSGGSLSAGGAQVGSQQQWTQLQHCLASPAGGVASLRMRSSPLQGGGGCDVRKHEAGDARLLQSQQLHSGLCCEASGDSCAAPAAAAKRDGARRSVCHGQYQLRLAQSATQFVSEPPTAVTLLLVPLLTLLFLTHIDFATCAARTTAAALFHACRIHQVTPGPHVSATADTRDGSPFNLMLGCEWHRRSQVASVPLSCVGAARLRCSPTAVHLCMVLSTDLCALATRAALMH